MCRSCAAAGSPGVWFVAFIAADENLNKAHVHYLEARRLALAKIANQWVLENSAAPNQSLLSEADRADCFLDEMLLIYPILGIDAFEAAANDPAPARSDGELIMDGRGALSDDGSHYVFTQDYRFSSPSTAASVLAGGSSNGRKTWKAPDGNRILKQLQDQRAAATPDPGGG